LPRGNSTLHLPDPKHLPRGNYTMENLENCPICSNKEFLSLITCKDYTVSGELFSVVKCASCSFVFTNPRPGKNEIGPYYKSTKYISHSNSSDGLFNKIYKLIRNRAINQKIELITGLLGRGKHINIADIGCGTGEFLAGCSKKGWNAVGVEPSPEARMQGEQNHGLSIFDEGYLESTNEKFDVITLWHVLEHVHGLNERIVQLSRLLTEKGILLIAVPNYTCFDAAYFGDKWAAWDVPRHLYHFSPDTIKALFTKHGFRHKDSKPMPYDAFYVSLLSSEYAYGKKNYLKGSLVGLKSNLKAGRNPEKYSSVIYIFEK
jgi:2-polyprenyl-3-methyl-5-hydroxy-6-metoxy-1,4-benzoquinol methylase